MAESIAWRHAVRVPGADVDEFKSITYEALCKAADYWIPYTDRNGFSPWSEDDPGRPEKHFPGYAAKMMNGAVLDWCRRSDYLSRTARKRVKAVQAAEAAGARSETGLAEASGLTAVQVRDARAADAVRPVSFDAELYDVPDSGDVEGRAELREMLAAVVAAFDALDPVSRVLLAFTFHQELDITVAARAVYLEPAKARQQLEAAVCAIHQAMLRQVSAALDSRYARSRPTWEDFSSQLTGSARLWLGAASLSQSCV